MYQIKTNDATGRSSMKKKSPVYDRTLVRPQLQKGGPNINPVESEIPNPAVRFKNKDKGGATTETAKKTSKKKNATKVCLVKMKNEAGTLQKLEPSQGEKN